VTSKFDLLLEFVRANGRVCPQPLAWQKLFLMLPDRTREGPPPPPIGDAWHATNDLDKTMLLIDHIQWAAEHGAFREANNFLRTLSEKDWYRGGDD
jgi:hypothetical protein